MPVDLCRRIIRGSLLVALAFVASPVAAAAAATYGWAANTSIPTDPAAVSVPHSAEDLAVSADGIVATGANWVENAHDATVYDQQGHALGNITQTRGDPHNGVYGVDVTSSWLYATTQAGIVRWDRATMLDPANDWWPNDPDGYLPISGTGGLRGVAVCGSEAYTTDNGGTLRVVNANLTGGVLRSWSVPRAQYLDCDRQGSIWVLQKANGSASAHLARYSPSGSLLGGFDVSGIPMDVAANPNADEVLIADNGPDQRVEGYDYNGNPTRTIGVQGGYLAGPTPGLIGPDRFVAPHGVAIDAAGNVYVDQGAWPGSSAEWQPSNIVSRINPDGSQAWRAEGLHFAAVSDESDDGSRLYSAFWSFDRGSDGRWKTRALTINPFSNPGDRRASQTYESWVFEREFGGQTFLFNDNDIQIYRKQGELFVPSTRIKPGGDGVGYIDIPGQSRKTPSGFDNRCGATDWFPQVNGDIWLSCRDYGGVWRYRYEGVTAAGDPIYTYAATDVYPSPPELPSRGRIEVAGGAVYLSGAGPGESLDSPNAATWQYIGPRVVKYPSLPSSSGWPTPTWSRTLPLGTSNNLPVSMAFDGSSVAVGYQAAHSGTCGACVDGSPYVRMFDAATGSETMQLAAPAGYRAGWFDMTHSIVAKDGVQHWEEDYNAKVIEACASSACGSQPPPPPPPSPPPPDTTLPETTITGRPSGSTSSTSASFAFTSSESPTTFERRLRRSFDHRRGQARRRHPREPGPRRLRGQRITDARERRHARRGPSPSPKLRSRFLRRPSRR
ncbi:MAG TPA: hypothetical protein VLB47_01860 [Solirubrobacteraceae bacterium]|nr:hypothetical protein [Solirubrobacteraceae bacterium]